MACECCRGDVVHCDLSTVHHCSPSSRQAVTSGYLVQNPCCHHAHSPSHTHMSHQHISTPSHCHNCHPFTNRSHSNEEYYHHAHSSLSHHEQKHIPVIASPLHISHTHTPPPRQMQCSGGIYDTSIQFLTPQSHSRPSCQSQRQLLTPPPRNLLPHFHSGITTPTHRPHGYQQLQQSPLSSYAQPLPESPEHHLPQVEFSSPLGENNMIGSSCFLLVHPTAPRPNSQPDENQHFYPQNAALQVNPLDESVHTSSMPQYQVQDMARQPAQTAPTSAFQPVTKSEPPLLPRNMAIPVVVVEKLPTSTLPKREVSSTPPITASVGQSSMAEDPLFDPMIEENKGNPVEEKVLVKSKKSRRKRCLMLDNEHSAGTSYTDTEDERPSETERKRTLRSFKQRQASSVHGDLESESHTSLSLHSHSRKPTGVTTDTESDGTQSEVEGNRPKPPLRKRYGLRSRTRGMTDSEQEEIDSSQSLSSRLLQRKHHSRSATDTDDSQSEQDGTQSRKKEKTRQQVNCEQGSVLKSGDVAVEGAAPEKKNVPEDAILSQSKVSPSGDGSGKTGRKVVVLSNWYFKVMVAGSSCVVLLQGTKADDASGMLWHSGPVVERLSSRELATKSGTVYRLEGTPDQAALTEVGISDKKITRSFKNGFPKNWLPLIEKHAMGGKEAVSATENVAAPLEVSKTLDKGGKLKVKSEPEELRTPNLDVSTDFLSSLKRSSRGRTIKPSTFNMSPYLNLSDNVYSYDMHGSFQGISSPVIDLTLCEVLDQQKKVKRQVKKERDDDSLEDCLPRKKKESNPQKSEPRKQTTQAGNWETTLAAETKQKLSGDHSVDSCAAGLVPGGKPRRKRARRLCIPRLPRKSKVETVIEAETITVYNGEDDQTVEDEMVKNKVEKTKNSVNKGKGKGRGQTQSQPGDNTEGEESIPWSGAAVKSLKSIVHAVPAMTPNFWEIVARRLGTGHSARECNNQYLHITTKRSKKKKAPQEKPANVATSESITSRVGTLKRKQMIRDVLQQLDEGYEDDIFDSTPFKKMKKVQVQDLSDEECFDEEGDGTESRPIQTPSEAKRKLGAPSPLTPKLCSYLTTPDLKGGMKRETADRVIRQVQKVKKGTREMKHRTKTDAPCPFPGKTKPLLFEQRLRSIRTGEITTLHLFEDSDDSSNDSNPFSDPEENYRDIISRLH